MFKLLEEIVTVLGVSVGALSVLIIILLPIFSGLNALFTKKNPDTDKVTGAKMVIGWTAIIVAFITVEWIYYSSIGVASRNAVSNLLYPITLLLNTIEFYATHHRIYFLLIAVGIFIILGTLQEFKEIRRRKRQPKEHFEYYCERCHKFEFSEEGEKCLTCSNPSLVKYRCIYNTGHLFGKKYAYVCVSSKIKIYSSKTEEVLLCPNCGLKMDYWGLSFVD